MNHDEPNETNHSKENQDDKSVIRKEYIEEYKLVPLEEYNSNEDEAIVDVVGILKDLWVNRWFIYKVTALTFILGLIIYIGSEKIYYSEAKLMPESSTETSQLGQVFRQAENIFGIQRTPEEEGINVAMYPFIVESLPFQIELMQQEVYFSDIDQRVTIFDYFVNHYNEPIFSWFSQTLWDFTFGLPATIKNLFTSKDDEMDRVELDFSEFRDFDQPTVLNNDVRNVANLVKDYITIAREPQSGFINVGVSFSDPYAATEMVILVKNLLQEYVIDYRTEKAIKNLIFIEEQFEEAKSNFQMRQDSLAAFQDRNMNVQMQSMMVREERLQFEMELAFALYNNIGRRLQEAKIQVQEETPVFRLHEPATIPTTPASPKSTRMLGGALIVGLFLGITLFYARRGFHAFMEEFHKKDISYHKNRV